MYCDVAFIQMSDKRVFFDAWVRRRTVVMTLRDKHRDGCSLWVIIFPGNIKNVCADDGADLGQDIGQSFGIVCFINVFNIFLVVLRCPSIANVVNVEAKRLGQIIEAQQLQFRIVGLAGQLASLLPVG